MRSTSARGASEFASALVTSFLKNSAQEILFSHRTRRFSGIEALFDMHPRGVQERMET